jgi:hypothetical protein
MKNKEYIRKNITIEKLHKDFLDRNNINLSRFVQSKLDEEMRIRDKLKGGKRK